MAKIINPTRLRMRLPSGHMLPVEGEITVTNDVLDGDNAAVLASLTANGVTVERDPDPASEPVALAEPAPKPRATKAPTPDTKEA